MLHGILLEEGRSAQIPAQVFGSHQPKKSNSLFYFWLSPLFHSASQDSWVATRQQLDKARLLIGAGRA